MSINNRHRFVMVTTHQGNGWWLKITSEEELLAYHAEHDNRYARAMENIIRGKEFGSGSIEHGPHLMDMPLAQSVWFHAMNQKQSVIESVMDISTSVFAMQLKYLTKNGCIYINKHGGWCPELDSNAVQFLDKANFAFPDFFDKKDIRVLQFPNGNHFYAYIGNMQVRDGEILKWNTREEAYERALQYCE